MSCETSGSRLSAADGGVPAPKRSRDDDRLYSLYDAITSGGDPGAATLRREGEKRELVLEVKPRALFWMIGRNSSERKQRLPDGTRFACGVVSASADTWPESILGEASVIAMAPGAPSAPGGTTLTPQQIVDRAEFARKAAKQRGTWHGTVVSAAEFVVDATTLRAVNESVRAHKRVGAQPAQATYVRSKDKKISYTAWPFKNRGLFFRVDPHHHRVALWNEEETCVVELAALALYSEAAAACEMASNPTYSKTIRKARESVGCNVLRKIDFCSVIAPSLPSDALERGVLSTEEAEKLCPDPRACGASAKTGHHRRRASRRTAAEQEALMNALAAASEQARRMLDTRKRVRDAASDHKQQRGAKRPRRALPPSALVQYASDSDSESETGGESTDTNAES